MKIIRLTTFLDFGGVEKRLTNVASVEDSNEWVFCAINKGGQAEKEILEKGKQVHCLNLSYKIPNPATVYSLYRFFKTHKPDVVHTSGAEANFFGIIAATLAGVKVIIGEEIGIPQHSSKAKFIYSTIYKFANFIAGNSQQVLDAVHEQNNVPYSKLVKIANPIIFKEIPTKEIKDFSDYQFKLLMISRLEPVKNIKAVLNVMERLVKLNHKVHLTIAGSGSLDKELRDQVKDQKLDNQVNFIGFITNPYPHLLSSDLYVLNSFTEGFSNSLVEAMYSRTPALSTSVGSAPEIIEDGKNGFLVEPDNEDLLFNKILEIMKTPKEHLLQIGKSGHKTVVNNFSLEKHILELMKIYKN